MSRKTLTLERVYEATAEDVWSLWTTKDGLESWWGPEGFSMKVHKLDLKPGGELLYALTATGQPQIDFMKRAGAPLAQKAKITYRDIAPLKRLAYVNTVDFVPDVAAYDVETVVELKSKGKSVQLHITLDAMHDEVWTKRMVQGFEEQLGKLGKVLAS
jgi:uncharacterized protein YndB with AHSA1/START domain